MNALVARNERKYASELAGMNLEKKLFMGIMLSGHMFYDNVKECLPHAADIMADRGLSDMELLFHPGDVTEDEDVKQLTSKDDLSFLFENSDNRHREAEALKKFGGNLRR